jgi:hypothetical protein
MISEDVAEVVEGSQRYRYSTINLNHLISIRSDFRSDVDEAVHLIQRSPIKRYRASALSPDTLHYTTLTS